MPQVLVTSPMVPPPPVFPHRAMVVPMVPLSLATAANLVMAASRATANLARTAANTPARITMTSAGVTRKRRAIAAC
jgi:hypothetical protein